MTSKTRPISMVLRPHNGREPQRQPRIDAINTEAGPTMGDTRAP